MEAAGAFTEVDFGGHVRVIDGLFLHRAAAHSQLILPYSAVAGNQSRNPIDSHPHKQDNKA